MPKLVTVAALAAALLAPATARAELVLGARLGWAVPAGQLVPGLDLSATLSGAGTVEVEAGWNVWRGLTLGGYGSYGVARIDTYLDNQYQALGRSTSGRIYHLGVRAELAFRALAEGIVPWLALGAGWQRADFDVGGDFSYAGWDLVRLEAGADWKAWRGLAVGPFLTWSLGRYTRLGGGSISGAANHVWVTFGLRGTWGP